MPRRPENYYGVDTEHGLRWYTFPKEHTHTNFANGRVNGVSLTRGLATREAPFSRRGKCDRGQSSVNTDANSDSAMFSKNSRT